MTGTRFLSAVLGLVLFTPLLATDDSGEEEEDSAGQVSYYEQIRPIFQARCHGCHQPAKPNGEYVMTTFDRLVAGGESESPAIVSVRRGHHRTDR